MKKFIFSAEGYLLRNYKYIILIILLFILFILNVEKQNKLNYLLNKDFTGTYITGEAITGDAEYFVFSDNNYCKYKQFNIIQEGEYEKAHDNVYILNNELKEYIVHSNNEIYYFNLKQNEVFIYRKIADNSLYINVPNTKK